MPNQSDRLRTHSSSLLAVVLLAAMCVSLPGCVFSKWSGPTMPSWLPRKSIPCVLPPNASKSELIAHLNENISKLNSWRSTDVRIGARGPGGLPVKLSAVIAVESPRNFRLRARSLLGGDEADLGSNAERFWFWMRRGGEPNYVFTARHDELHLVQQRMPIPFQPDWLMEVLGVIPIDESQYTLERHGTEAGTVNLISDRLSPDGRPVRQVVLVDTCYGFIKQHTLYDSRGRLIASAVLKNHKTDPSTGVTLPRRIDLHWPQTKLSLTMYLDTVEINPERMPEQTWRLPHIPDCPPFDMGPGLQGNRPGHAARGGFDVRTRLSEGNRPDRPNPFVRTADTEEPPWETDTEVPKAQNPIRRSIWSRPKPFQRR